MLIYKQVILSSPFILTCALTNTSSCFISSHLKNKLQKKVKQDHVLSALLIFKSCYSQGEIIFMGFAVAGFWSPIGALSFITHLFNIKRASETGTPVN